MTHKRRHKNIKNVIRRAKEQKTTLEWLVIMGMCVYKLLCTLLLTSLHILGHEQQIYKM